MISRSRAVFYLVLVNVLWGLSFPTVKALNLQLDQHFQSTVDPDGMIFRIAAATWIVGLRFVSALFLFAICFRAQFFRASFGEWAAGSLIGLFFVTGVVMQVIGLATIPASRSGFLTSLTVVFTPLVAAVLHGRRPSIPVLLGVGLSIIGVALLTGLIAFNQRGLHIAPDALKAWKIGDTLTVVSTIFFTFQILSIDHFSKSMRASGFTPGMFLTVGLVSAAVFYLTVKGGSNWKVGDFVAASQPVSFWSLIVLLAVFPSLLSFSWMNTYQPRVTAVQAAVIYTLEPVFVTSWAMLLPGLFRSAWTLPMFNEQLTVPIALGGAVILLANVFALWPAEVD